MGARTAALLAALALAATARATEPLPTVQVHMPAPCLACIEWADHLRQNGFPVALREEADMAAVKRRLKVPPDVESVHSATVAGYFVEGHVPADDIKELLREKPKARGIAVPGLPRGAPGRDVFQSKSCETGCVVLDGQPAEVRRELYETLLILPDGTTRIYARH